MILRFAYLDEPLYDPPPPSLPDDAQRRWRPLIPFSVAGPNGRSVSFGRALVDPGPDETVLPLDTAGLLAVSFYPATSHSWRWRGQRHSLRYGDVTLELMFYCCFSARCWGRPKFWFAECALPSYQAR